MTASLQGLLKLSRNDSWNVMRWCRRMGLSIMLGTVSVMVKEKQIWENSFLHKSLYIDSFWLLNEMRKQFGSSPTFGSVGRNHIKRKALAWEALRSLNKLTQECSVGSKKFTKLLKRNLAKKCFGKCRSGGCRRSAKVFSAHAPGRRFRRQIS